MQTLLLFNSVIFRYAQRFPGSSVGKESACTAGDTGLITGSGRPPGKGNSNLLQYF